MHGKIVHKVGITLVITIAKDAKPTVLDALIILVTAFNVRTDRWICSTITLVAAKLADSPTLPVELILFHWLNNLSQLNGLLVINLTEL